VVVVDVVVVDVVVVDVVVVDVVVVDVVGVVTGSVAIGEEVVGAMVTDVSSVLVQPATNTASSAGTPVTHGTAARWVRPKRIVP
jgi:hypothetical protein